MSAPCTATTTAAIKSTAFLQHLAGTAAARRVPLSGTIELTQRCNVACVHCYLGSHREPGTAAGPGSGGRTELGTERWLSVLAELAEAGCLFLLLTGGEPLLRRDFVRVYRHARELGLLVTVFTNGTLVREEHCVLFAELPPSLVEVTLYGATAGTYEAVTGVAGSFEKCLAGVRRLLGAGVRVGLKTVVLTTNRHELDAMRALAESLGVPFRFDVIVSARMDGDLSPLGLRLSPEEALAVELSDETRFGQWRKHHERLKGLARPEGLYGCGAGVSSFFLDARGVMFPCLMARSVSYDVGGADFSSGWLEVMPKVREFEAGGMETCNRCESRAVCDVCPGVVAWETGSEDGWSEYLCTIGKTRDAAVARAAGGAVDTYEGRFS